MYIKNNKSHRENTQGFTLIEMAISLIVVGVLMAGAMHLYSLYLKNEQITRTNEVVSKVNVALQAFKNAYGRYPCPAPIKEPRTSANYGREIDCSGNPGASGTPIALMPSTGCTTSATTRGGREVCQVSAADYAKYSLAGATKASSANYASWISGITMPENCADYVSKFFTTIYCERASVNSLVNAYNALLSASAGDPARTLVGGQCLNGGSDPVDGICIETSPRTDLATPPRVRMGGVPFRDLQIEEKDTVDGYGSRLVYAVTEKLANASTYKEREGGIKIVDSTGTALSDGQRSAAFIVVSPGPNRNGAVNLYGSVTPCTGTGLDSQNCRDFSSITNTSAVYAMDVTALDYDDTVAFFIPNENAFWRRIAPTSEDVTDLSEGRVGVGIGDPTLITDTLTVGQSSVNYTTNPSDFGKHAITNGSTGFQTGSLRVGDGTATNNKLFASMYCDQSGANCFTPENIMAPYDSHGSTTAGNGMGGCPSGEYMIGIQEGHPLCAPVRFSCESQGKVFVGFNSDGSPKCETPIASCPLDNVSICGSPRVLPASGNGVSVDFTYTTGGACATKSYICNAGTWRVKDASDGAAYDPWHYDAWHCSFNSSTPPTGSTAGVACGTGYTGTYTQNWVNNCLGGQSNTTSTFSTDCTCVGISDTEDYFCPTNFGGNKVATRTRTKGCTGNTLDTNWTYGGWEDLSGIPVANPASLCTCSKTDYWDFANCDSGMVRTSSPSPASFSSPAASWPASTAVGKYRQITADTTNCVYNPAPAYNTSNCICDPAATQFVDRTPSCGSCDEVNTNSKIRQIRSGVGCGWVDDPDTSANIPGTCKPKKFIWKSDNVVAGTASLSDGRGTAVDPNSNCTCADSTTTRSCAVSSVTGWTFYTCTCTYSP